MSIETIRKELGIPDLMGCVMLDVEHFSITELYGLDRQDLYTSPDREGRFRYVDGETIAKEGHVTLLYGLMPQVRYAHVEDQLTGWQAPRTMFADHLEVFPSPEPAREPYDCLVAVIKDPRLDDANARLRKLPHVSDYPTYKSHVTLAYVRAGVGDAWVDTIGASGVPLSFRTTDVRMSRLAD